MLREPLPVSREDVLAFWDAYYSTRVGDTVYPALPPDENDDMHRHLLAQIGKGIAQDRRRVVERENG